MRRPVQEGQKPLPLQEKGRTAGTCPEPSDQQLFYLLVVEVRVSAPEICPHHLDAELMKFESSGHLAGCDLEVRSHARIIQASRDEQKRH
jgi:hypothetical protein